MQIAGKTALVSGGASGLGAAVVRAIVGAGGSVVIADRNDSSGIALAGELGPRAVFALTDVTEPESVAAAIGQARELGGGALHIAVSCAGIAAAHRILGKHGAMPLDAFRRVIEVNLIGTFNVLRLAAEAMAENAAEETGERGVIVNTASIAAFEGQIGQSAYAASKGGVAGLTLPAARDLARHGIRVMAVAPGMFRTPLLAGLPKEAIDALEAQVPFPARLGEPPEFAAIVRQIIENPYLNGEVIRLDGALRMTPK
jgi:NAD(P)-dependent dehydrogenase (short-subunit alcohol dehydrogenase family)